MSGWGEASGVLLLDVQAAKEELLPAPRRVCDLLRKQPKLHAYVLRTNYISTHIETKSLRRAQNGYFCSHFINC